MKPISPTTLQSNGPSGFIKLAGLMLVVDYGRIYHHDQPIGYLYEDGFLKDTSGPLAHTDGTWLIDDFPDLSFQGIDAHGQQLNLPGAKPGPSGSLNYNGRALTVLNGRLTNENHCFLGVFDDFGQISLRDASSPDGLITLDEHTTLFTDFIGIRSDGTPWQYQFSRPLLRRDKSYSVNEIIRYFQGFDDLTGAQKKYVIETMSLWASVGLLQVVRRSEGDASLGNVKHGAAGVTGVRTGNVTLDREEFNREIELYQQFGALAVVSKGIKNYTEVRINLVVAHEFGHQLEFILTQATQQKISELYERHRGACDKAHPLPAKYNGLAELLEPQQVMSRHFLSGYARASAHEYWAESVAAFSIKDSRQKLKELDPGVYSILEDLVFRPTKVLQITHHNTIASLQASLRLGGELHQDLLA
jgi:hypothetical protein